MFKKRIFIGSFIRPENPLFYSKIKKDFDQVTIGRWVPTENFHVTYKFLGEVDEGELTKIYKNLSDILNKPIKVNLDIQGLGVFPDFYRPRVFFMNVKDKEEILKKTYDRVETVLDSLGYKPEKRKFIPHITIKRFKSVKRNLFKKILDSYTNEHFYSVNSIEVNIIESILERDGAVYKKIIL
ncbi:RNA 2',3'-cyclic phosphodiesterase [Persephonella sp.]